jgi:hypothetical protein
MQSADVESHVNIAVPSGARWPGWHCTPQSVPKRIDQSYQHDGTRVAGVARLAV